MVGEWPTNCRCQICLKRKAATSGFRFGLPLSCPKCRAKGDYFGILKIPGEKVTPFCPNCKTQLVSSDGRGRIREGKAS